MPTEIHAGVNVKAKGVGGGVLNGVSRVGHFTTEPRRLRSGIFILTCV
jgi:hypothetical protein